MLRTQILLTDEERRLLDAAAARTGRSVAALIREAVDGVYGPRLTMEDDLSAISASAGAWEENNGSSEEWVDRMRSGRRISRADDRR